MSDSAQDVNAQQPLRGVVLCCTALAQEIRNEYGSIAESMGAVHKLDLTSDVTHLVIGDVDTLKYKHVAKERPDIYVLGPSWIQAVRDSWVKGDDTDVAALTAQHRLPTFFGLNICVTGFEDLNQRQYIQNTVVKNGAAYHGDLTKVVTHLIAAKPQGAKYDRAKTWGMKLVSLKWFEESLERGMVLEEALYDPLVPHERQGEGAFLREAERRSILGKRPQRSGKSGAQDDVARRKMRRTASTRLSSHSQNLWADISTTELENDAGVDDRWMKNDDAQFIDRRPADSVVKGGSDSDHISGEVTAKTTKRTSQDLRVDWRQGLFSNWACMVYGHESRIADKIRALISENGGSVAISAKELPSTIDDDSLRTALILPSNWTGRVDADLPAIPQGTAIVTEFWIERCILHRSPLEPDEDVLSRSLHRLPKDCFAGWKISTSGLGQDVRLLSRIIESAGGAYVETLGRDTSILVHNPKKQDMEKPLYAVERGIPVVAPTWLLQSIASGQRLPVSDHKLPASTLQAVDRLRKERGRASRGDKEATEAVKRKDAPPAQRLSAVRKRAATPSLSLARTKATNAGRELPVQSDETRQNIDTQLTSRKSKGTMPFVEETPSETGSQPLDELPPDMNSPRKRSPETNVSTDRREDYTTATDAKLQDSSKSYVEDYVGKENQQHQDEAEHEHSANLSRVMSDLLARRQASNSSSTDQCPPLRRRKDRKLGRAHSGNSNTTSFTRPAFEIADSVDTASPLTDDVTGPIGGANQPPLPSQQLTYDAPGAEEHRRMMSKKLGTKLLDERGTRVESLGLVRDADVSGFGVGERVRGRHRDGRTK